MWQTSSNFVRPNMTVEAAHIKDTETGSIVFSVDGRTVLTRGGDDTVKRTYPRETLCQEVADSFIELSMGHQVV